MIADMAKLKADIDAAKLKPDLRDKIIRALGNAVVSSDVAPGMENETVDPIQANKKRKDMNTVCNENIVSGKRKRAKPANFADEQAEDEASSGGGSASSESGAKDKPLPLYRRPVGTRISITSTHFDGDKPGSFSKGKPEKMYGTIVMKKGAIMRVLWDGDDDPIDSHWRHLEPVTGAEKTTCWSIMAVIAEGVKLQYKHSDMSLPWPKTFFDALLRSDWRGQVAAMKKDVKGWLNNNAFTEVQASAMEVGDAIILLGKCIHSNGVGGTSSVRSPMASFVQDSG